MASLTSFVLSYMFLIILIFLCCTFLQRTYDSYESDPDILTVAREANWYYWLYFTFCLMNVFATMVLIVGLHESSCFLVLCWLSYHAAFTIFELVISVFCTIRGDTFNALIYHYTFAAINFGILIYIYLEFLAMKKRNKQ